MTDNVTQLRARREILDDLEIQRRVNQRIEELNKTFTHIVSNGKNYVIRVSTNSLNQPYLEFFSIKEFKDMLSHDEKVLVGYTKTMDEKIKPIADVWLQSPNANLCKEGITFYPKNERFFNGKLNSYFGLGTKPTPYEYVDIGAYLLHLELIICNGDKTCYEYLLNWLAHLVQKPEEKPEVAIVLKAGQGTGKGTFVDPIGRIIGAHFVHLMDKSAVTGNFNALVENRILIFADEFFAGSKRDTDQLKGLITEKTTKIERKHIDGIIVPSFSRLIMASNHENIVSIEKDERRYLYLEVSEERKQDHDYFEALRRIIDGPKFIGQLLQFLLERDISEFNPRRVPQTKALGEQKLDNLDPLERWLYTILSNGSINGREWLAREQSNKLVEHAENWLDAKRLEVWGDLNRKLGRLLKSVGCNRVKVRQGDKTVWYQEFPALNEVRANFSNYLNTEIDF